MVYIACKKYVKVAFAVLRTFSSAVLMLATSEIISHVIRQAYRLKSHHSLGFELDV